MMGIGDTMHLFSVVVQGYKYIFSSSKSEKKKPWLQMNLCMDLHLMEELIHFFCFLCTLVKQKTVPFYGDHFYI